MKRQETMNRKGRAQKMRVPLQIYLQVSKIYIIFAADLILKTVAIATKITHRPYYGYT